MMIERKNCPVCEGTRQTIVRVEKNSSTKDPLLAKYFEVDSELARCMECGMQFVHKLPVERAFYSRLYADTGRDISIDFIYSGKMRIFREILRTLLWFEARGPLLDYGTGTGAFLREASMHFNAKGVELGKAARAFALARGLDVQDAPDRELPFSTKSFGIVTLIDVLEHVPEPSVMLKKLNAVLRPGGLIYIKVPNGPAQIAKQNFLKALGISNAGVMADYIHVNHFNPSSLNLLLERTGFAPKETGWSGAEIWDLRWKDAPKPLLSRVIFNAVAISVTRVLNTFAKVTGASCGLNFYVVAEKK